MFGLLLPLLATSAGWGTFAVFAVGLAGALLDQAIFAPKPPTQEVGKLADPRAMDASYGAPIPVVLGNGRVAGNVIWIGNGGDWIERVTVRKVRTGLFSKQKIRTYHYSLDLAVGLCAGNVSQVRRIWFGDTVIYEWPNRYYGCAGVTIYAGSEDQPADPLMVADMGAGNVPGYRGLCYAVIHGLDADILGAAMQPISAEILMEAEAVKAQAGSLIATDIEFAAPGGGSYFSAGAIHNRPQRMRDGNFLKMGYETISGGDNPIICFVAEILEYTGDGVNLVKQVRSSEVTLYHSGIHYQWTLSPDGSTALFLMNAGLSGDGAHGTLGIIFDCDNYEIGAPFYRFLGLGASPGATGGWIDSTHFFVPGPGGFYGALSIQLFEVKGLTAKYLDDFDVFPAGEYTESSYVYMTVPLDGGAMIFKEYVSGGDSYFQARHVAYQPVWNAALNVTVPNIVLGPRIISAGGFPSTFNGGSLVYDAETGRTWACYLDDAQRVALLIVSRDSINVSDSLVVSGSPMALFYGGAFPHRGGLASVDYYSGGRYWNQIDVDETGALVWSVVDQIIIDSDEWSSLTPTYAMGCGVSSGRFILNTIDGYRLIQGHSEGQPADLSACVAYWLDAAGYDSGDYDLTVLEGIEVPGQIMAPPYTARAAIEALQAAHGFDLIASGEQLVAVLRGSTSLVTISAGDLGARRAGEAAVPPLERRRMEANALPRATNVRFLDSGQLYQPGVARASRQAGGEARSESSLELPLVLDASAAKQIAERALYTAWRERELISARLSRAHIRVEPSDVVTLGTEKIRVMRATLTADGLAVEGVPVGDGSAYVSTAESDPPATAWQGVGVVPRGRLLVLDLPAIADDDDQPGLWLAVAAGTGWRGGTVQRSADGVTWLDFADVPVAATVAYATEALGDGSSTIFNPDQTLAVRVVSGTPETVARADLDAGANLAALGDEILAFLAAESGDEWTLTGLYRGLRGTEWATADHALGEALVVIDDAVLFVPLPLAELGLPWAFRLVEPGVDAATASPVWIVPQGRTLKPYTPANFAGMRDGGDDLTLTWTRRARINNGLVAGVDVPLDEPVESYEVDVLDGGGAVVRTLTSTTETATYTAAMATADGLSPSGPVDFRLYQISARVGRGWPAEASI